MIPSLQVASYSQQQETTHSSPIMLFGSNEIYWTALWSHVPSSQMQSTFSHEKKTDQVLLWQRDACTESTYMQNLSAAFQLFVSYFLKNKTTTAEKEKKKPSALSSWLYWCQLLTRQCRIRPEVQRLSGKQHHNEKLWSSMKECGSFKVGVFEDRRWFIFPLGEELKLKLGTDL